MSRPDAELVRDALDGESRAFEELVRRYERLVFRIIYHHLGRVSEVEDLAQDVFLKLYGSLNRFDTSRPLKSWIARIAVNRCLDELRKHRKRKTSVFSDFGEEEENRIRNFYEKSRTGESLTEGEAANSYRWLQIAMERLPQDDRTAFLLREVEGLEYSEIAEALGVSQLAARIRVSRSRKKLQQALKVMLYGRQSTP